MSPSRMRQGGLLVRVDRKKDETTKAESKSLEPRKKVLDIRNAVRYNELIKNGLVRLACSSLIIEYERVIYIN